MNSVLIRSQHHDQHNEPSHPEQAARIRAIMAGLEQHGLLDALTVYDATPATEAQLRVVHDAQMITRVQQAAAQSIWLNPDTYTTAGTWDAALYAAGAAIQAVDLVASRQATNAFAIVRPPGHHATARQSMGFCMFNNIAVAARHARNQYGIERIAIVDYDVHHGNGTQDIFYDDPQVLFCSSHGAPLYPGTGAEEEIGAGLGRGTTLNAPVPFGTGDASAQLLYDQVFLPVLHRFRPQLILVSAGYDAHWADPIGPLAFSIAGYAALTSRLARLAEEICDGRIVLVLEGGYHLDALQGCVLAALQVLLGREPGPDPLGAPPVRERDLSRLIARLQKLFDLA